MAEMTDKIVCSICLSDFSEPKLIDCHHCFCFRCLDGYVEKFTVDNHFPCPLCRLDSEIPAGGVKNFATNFDMKESSCSTGEGQRNQELCDVCKKVNYNFQCADCDKLLCFSCKSCHDVFYDGSNHNVTDLTKSDKIQTKPEISEDFCANHGEKPVDFYCKDCKVAMCWLCFVENHNGHPFIKLTDEVIHQEFREEIISLKQELKNQISKFKSFSDCLEVKVGEVSEMADKLCSQVDFQIQKIYEELKSLGEKMKIRVNDWRDKERNKLNAVKKEIQMECENVGQIVDNSDNVLENKSFVQLIEILPDIRKEQKKQNQRKLDIPFVKSIKFVEGNINSDSLSKQIGILERPSSLEVGQTFYFTTNFNESQVSDDVTWKPADGDDVIPWTVGVERFEGFLDIDEEEMLLRVFVKLDNITDKTIQRVDVKVSHKLINNNNDSQSVSKEDNYKISPGCLVGYDYLINYFLFNNKQNGFLDSNNNFRIQTTITITGLSQ